MHGLRLKDIKKDQKFFESERGCDIAMTALEDARRVRRKYQKGYVCKVLLANGKTLELFESFDAGAYHLRLYGQRQYTMA